MSEVVHLEVSETVSQDFPAARFEIEKAARDLFDGAKKTWIISQSLAEELVFNFFGGTLPAGFESSIAGRIFNEKAELRWLRDSGVCRFWQTKEVEEAAHSTAHRKKERRYYLWGMHTKDRLFSENRTVGEFTYPLPEQVSPRVDDRAFIVVAEYYVAQPPSWPASADEVERILNKPAIVGHRYLSVGCGRGE